MVGGKGDDGECSKLETAGARCARASPQPRPGRIGPARMARGLHLRYRDRGDLRSRRRHPRSRTREHLARGRRRPPIALRACLRPQQRRAQSSGFRRKPAAGFRIRHPARRGAGHRHRRCRQRQHRLRVAGSAGRVPAPTCDPIAARCTGARGGRSAGRDLQRAYRQRPGVDARRPRLRRQPWRLCRSGIRNRAAPRHGEPAALSRTPRSADESAQSRPSAGSRAHRAATAARQRRRPCGDPSADRSARRQRTARYRRLPPVPDRLRGESARNDRRQRRVGACARRCVRDHSASPSARSRSAGADRTLHRPCAIRCGVVQRLSGDGGRRHRVLARPRRAFGGRAAAQRRKRLPARARTV